MRRRLQTITIQEMIEDDRNSKREGAGMALESVIEWQRAGETIRKYVEQHPGCRMQDVVAGTEYTYAEIAGVVEGMVDGGRLERWWSYGFAHFYIQGTHTPMPTTRPPQHDKTSDRYIEAYLDAFDEFCDAVSERYGAKVIGNLTSEAMINLYRGFIAALPDLERSAQGESHHKPNQATRSGMRTPEKYERDRTLLRKLRRNTRESIRKGVREHKAPLEALLHRDGRIHVYIDGEDSGVNIARQEDGTLLVKVGESLRNVVVGRK